MAPRSVITIGSFDGVHRGHRALVEAARARATHESAPTPSRVLALAFDPHPLTHVNPGQAPERLSTFDDRRRWLLEAGADEVIRLDPSPDLLGLAPRAFIERVVAHHAPVAFVEGSDFRFGKARAGTTQTLTDLGRELGFEAIILPPVEVTLDDHSIVPASSTLCRWLLRHGRVRDAARVLGRPHRVPGTVVPGDRRGRTIGFPTANIRTDVALPADGVYAAWATLPDGRRAPAAVNVGARPTFAGAPPTLEAHILLPPHAENAAPLPWAPIDGLPEYGWPIALEFIARLRDQARFSGLPALTAQLRRDCARAADAANLGIPPIPAPEERPSAPALRTHPATPPLAATHGPHA